MKTKHIFLLGMITIFFIPQLFAQGFEGNSRWLIGIGMQEQDERLFDLNHLYARELVDSDNGIPTSQLTFSLFQPILHRYDFSIDLGLGYGLELNTFSRPFNRAPLLKDPVSIPSNIVLVGGYFVHLLTISASISLKIKKFQGGGMLFFSNDFAGSVNWLKWVRVKSSPFMLFGASRFQKMTLAPYSIEVNPGLGFQKGPVRMTVNYRLWQKKQVDPVLFSSRIYHNLPDDEYETYNPTKIWLTVSRDLDWGKGKELRR